MAALLWPTGLGLVVVTQVRRQPALGHAQFLTLARGVALHLILVDLAHGEILRLRVSEVPAADRCRREHGVVLGEEHAAAAGFELFRFRVQQLEQRGFLGVIRAGRVAWSRADAVYCSLISASLSSVSSLA